MVILRLQRNLIVANGQKFMGSLVSILAIDFLFQLDIPVMKNIGINMQPGFFHVNVDL